MKKIISIFLALVIIMTAIPIAPMPVAGRVVSDTDDEEEYTYYTGVKTYDTPITMCVKSEKAIIYKNLYDTAGQMEILREVKKNTKIQVTGEGKWDFDKIYFVKIGSANGMVNRENLKINLASPKNLKLKTRKYGFNVTWKKVNDPGVSGYQIQYSPNKKFKGEEVENIYIQNPNTTKKWVIRFEKHDYYVRIRSYIGDCEKETPGYKLKYSKFSKAKKVHTNKCHPVKDPFWDTEDLDGSYIITDEKVRGDAIRLQEEKERTGAIRFKEKQIAFINTGMSSLSESDIIDFSVPELYQGGERVEYNWRKIKWTCSNKKILKIKKSGEIVPKKEGKTYIKAVYKGQKIKIPVEVISPDLEMSNYKNNKQKHIITMTFKNNSSNDIKIDFSDLNVYGSAYDKYEDATVNISFEPRIIGEEEVLLHPEEKKKISFTYQPLKKRKINEGTIYFDIKYKGYDIDVMGINTDVSVYIYTLKDEL